MNEEMKIWKGYEELNNTEDFVKHQHDEFSEKLPLHQLGRDVENMSSTRRDFLKFMGFSLTAATVAAGCEMPVRKAIPYLDKPEEVIPGQSTWYASTYAENGDYCSILVKSRDGRPIKISGNPESKISGGGTNSRVQASVLDLYDNSRLAGPMMKKDGKWLDTEWSNIDEEIKDKLENIEGEVVILSSTILSPSTKQVINGFVNKYNAKHVTYDAVSASGILDANELCFGERFLPDYQFDKADVIVSFDADFLGGWLCSNEYIKGYSKGRKVNRDNPQMSRHIQFEASMSMTGTNADTRIFMKPSEETDLLSYMVNVIAFGGREELKYKLSDNLKAKADQVIAELQSSDNSLIVSGSNNKYHQVLVNYLNLHASNYSCISRKYANYRSSSDAEMVSLLERMNAGKIGAVILWDANPSYNYYDAEAFNKAFLKVGLKVSMSAKLDETSAHADYACPDHHYLESWNDACPKSGSYSLTQPIIAPLFNTRAGAESLMAWSGQEGSYIDFIKNYWEKNIYSSSIDGLFMSFWDKCLHDGVVERESKKYLDLDDFGYDLGLLKEGLSKTSSSEGDELALYVSNDIGDGHRANNPWLQECPDPVTKVTWDNYILMSKRRADELGIVQEDVVKLSIGDKSVELPVVLQPGQHKNVLGVALGYGRKLGGRIFDERYGGKVRLSTADYLNSGDSDEHFNFTSSWGENAYHMVTWNGENFIYNSSVSVAATGKEKYPIAQTQSHHHINAKLRPIVREVSLEEYKTDPYAGYAKYSKVEVFDQDGNSKGEQVKLIKSGKEEYLRIKNTRNQNLYYDPTPNLFRGDKKDTHVSNHADDDSHGHAKKEEPQKTTYPGHHWGLSVDLNSCIGCNACIVSCNAENNIPVVGKYEVRRRHDMHWMRIDRYYITEGNEDDNHGDDGDANPRVIHQPMMCQHCDNAPCENVCPVAATNHSTEGLNQMAYNRCVGTRYCENNCPYKVRRFNWYDYNGQDSFAWNEHIHDSFRTDKGDDIDDLTKMVLNPDVTVRARGVIEKCSFCVQILQEGKLKAKKEGRKLVDEDVRAACQSACPTDCITFGDMNDPESMVSKAWDNERNFHVIEEVHALPSVGYLTKVRNVNNKELNA